jgi:hypothetical protein
MRKHHCRLCGRIFCNDCSSKFVPGTSIGMPADTSTRLCDMCYDLVNDSSSSSSSGALGSAPPSPPRHKHAQLPEPITLGIGIGRASPLLEGDHGDCSPLLLPPRQGSSNTDTKEGESPSNPELGSQAEQMQLAGGESGEHSFVDVPAPNGSAAVAPPSKCLGARARARLAALIGQLLHEDGLPGAGASDPISMARS